MAYMGRLRSGKPAKFTFFLTKNTEVRDRLYSLSSEAATPYVDMPPITFSKAIPKAQLQMQQLQTQMQQMDTN